VTSTCSGSFARGYTLCLGSDLGWAALVSQEGGEYGQLATLTSLAAFGGPHLMNADLLPQAQRSQKDSCATVCAVTASSNS
jgi:hypothetical protein